MTSFVEHKMKILILLFSILELGAFLTKRDFESHLAFKYPINGSRLIFLQSNSLKEKGFIAART